MRNRYEEMLEARKESMRVGQWRRLDEWVGGVRRGFGNRKEVKRTQNRDQRRSSSDAETWLRCGS